MLIGYVSDEKYVALADVLIEFMNGQGESWEARSRAGGSIHCELPPGEYTATLSKPGFGSKRVRLTPQAWEPFQFRLLSDSLLGYAWPKCVRSGEVSRVFASTRSSRTSWSFGGTGGKRNSCVASAGTTSMARAPSCRSRRTAITRRPACSGTRSPWLSQPQSCAKGRSAGLHPGLLLFPRLDCVPGASFTFSVGPASLPCRADAPIAVLASDINWNAYNNFGGRSNYIHADGFPPTPTVNACQELKAATRTPIIKLWGCDSYAAPVLRSGLSRSITSPDPLEKITDPIEGRSAEPAMSPPAEWRLLGWLGARGIRVYDLYSETQLHHGVLDLSKYRVLILGPHPEYWTRKMYDTVKAWVFEQGGKLIYLGGNGLNCEVELLDADRMLCRNTKISSLHSSGMGGAESRFARRHESEANLLGVVFDPRGIMTAAPYRIIDSKHWCFAGTGLRAGQSFGEKSLHMRVPGGASGRWMNRQDFQELAQECASSGQGDQCG